MKKHSNSIVFDIGSKNIKIVVGGNKDNHIFIKDYAIIPTSEGAVYDGKIYQKTAVAENIMRFTKKQRTKRLNVKVSISSSDLILRTFEIPKMEEKELKQAVKFELEYFLPEAIEYYVIDFTVLEEYKKTMEDGDQIQVLKVQTVAIPKMIVDAYLETFDQAGLNIDIVDIQPNNLVKLFGGRKKNIKDFDDEETIDRSIAVIDLGNQKTSMTIIEDGKVFLNRVIDKGGIDISNVIADVLDINIEEAEEWKMNNSFLMESTNEALDLAIKAKMDELVEESKKIIDYFISRSAQKSLDRVYLIGGGAKTIDIAPYFEEGLKLTTRLGNDYRNIETKVDESKFSKDLLYLCNIIGILLRKD